MFCISFQNLVFMKSLSVEAQCHSLSPCSVLCKLVKTGNSPVFHYVPDLDLVFNVNEQK